MKKQLKYVVIGAGGTGGAIGGFLAKAGKDVTVKKMYLDALEEVLQKSNKVIVDPSQKGNLLPVLQLNNPQPQRKD